LRDRLSKERDHEKRAALLHQLGIAGMEKAELIAMHRTLGRWHLRRSKQVALDILSEHHRGLSDRLLSEADELEKSAEITDEMVRDLTGSR
jgi:hypothetical protein